MTSALVISPAPLTELYRPFRSLPCASQGVCNAGISLVCRQSDQYICLEQKLLEDLIRSGAARFEITILSRLKHPNTVRYLDAYIATQQKFHRPSASLYMHYCNRDSLADEIGKRRKDAQYFEGREIWDIFEQLVKALAYIQYGLSDAISHPEEAKDQFWIGPIHRDIKPENIFLQPNRDGGSPIVLLGDFGSAIQQDQHGKNIGEGFSLPGEWSSPEWPDFSFASDVWLVGSVMQECSRLKVITKDSKVIFAGVGGRYSTNLNYPVAQFMDKNPLKRPRLNKWAPISRGLRLMAMAETRR